MIYIQHFQYTIYTCSLTLSFNSCTELFPAMVQTHLHKVLCSILTQHIGSFAHGYRKLAPYIPQVSRYLGCMLSISVYSPHARTALKPFVCKHFLKRCSFDQHYINPLVIRQTLLNILEIYNLIITVQVLLSTGNFEEVKSGIVLGIPDLVQREPSVES